MKYTNPEFATSSGRNPDDPSCVVQTCKIRGSVIIVEACAGDSAAAGPMIVIGDKEFSSTLPAERIVKSVGEEEGAAAATAVPMFTYTFEVPEDEQRQGKKEICYRHGKDYTNVPLFRRQTPSDDDVTTEEKPKVGVTETDVTYPHMQTSQLV